MGEAFSFLLKPLCALLVLLCLHSSTKVLVYKWEFPLTSLAMDSFHGVRRHHVVNVISQKKKNYQKLQQGWKQNRN